jgi:hypothetical protein
MIGMYPSFKYLYLSGPKDEHWTGPSRLRCTCKGLVTAEEETQGLGLDSIRGEVKDYT